MNRITEFQGEHRFLSNFWPVEIELDGSVYPSVEHAYQAAKTEDLAWRERIRLAETRGQRSDWVVSPPYATVG